MPYALPRHPDACSGNGDCGDGRVTLSEFHRSISIVCGAVRSIYPYRSAFHSISSTSSGEEFRRASGARGDSRQHSSL
jgi:hypothetical protein